MPGGVDRNRVGSKWRWPCSRLKDRGLPLEIASTKDCLDEGFSMPLAEERLDRVVDIVLAVDAAGQDFLVVAEVFVEDVDEVPGAVGAGDLAVAEHVAGGEELLLEELDAVAAVGLGAVVAVGEVEEVDVPLVGAVVGVEQLLA